LFENGKRLLEFWPSEFSYVSFKKDVSFFETHMKPVVMNTWW